MGTRWFIQRVAAIVVSVAYPAIASAGVYGLTVAGERLEFVPQADKGYVIKLADRPGGISALSGLSIPDADEPRPLGGRGRRSAWAVENQGPAVINERTMATLRQQARVAYVAPLFSSNGERVAIIPEIVIRVKPAIAIQEVQRLSDMVGCTIRKRMEFTEQEYLLEVLGSDAEAVFTAAERLNQAPEVEWACPNTAFRPKLSGQAMPVGTVGDEGLCIASAAEDPNTPGVFPNDEYFPMQWHLYNIGQSGGTPGVDIRAPEAWEITTGDPNVVVAEFGGYVDAKHPDLANNLVPGHDFVTPGSSPVFDYWAAGHSTWCAGIVTAQGNNGIGVAGVTWNCKLMPIRIFADHANGHTFIAGGEIATAIRWAATNGADVMDNQWGYTTAQPQMQSALADVTKPGGIGRDGKGCVVVFSSGDGPSVWYPAKYPEVVAVGCTDHNDIWVPVISYGPELDIVAPDWGMGELRDEGLWTTDVTGLPGASAYPERHPDPNILDYATADGATSIVSGVAALILSIEPNLTGAEVRHFLERSAKDLGDPGRDDYYGWGRVDARAALDMVLAHRCDLNDDWRVDEQDLAILNAAIDGNDLSADVAPAKKRDGKVDQQDLELLTRYLGMVIPELGLIAHWKLDETEGTIIHDGAGEHHDATIMGVPLWQPEGGMIGGALQFSGVPNFATTKMVRNPAEGPLSVFAWVKGGAPGQVVISQQGGANWLMASTGDGALRTELKSADRQASALTCGSLITDGDWHRVGFSWDGKNRILYVDDTEVARDTQANLASSTGNLYIGTGSTMSPASFWKGLIDDVRIHDRAVTP